MAHRREGRVDLPRRQQAHAAAQHVEGQAGGRAPRPSAAEAGPRRHRLPDERQSITHKFDIAGHEGYITVGLYEDGQPGELFLTMAKEGSTISGFADAFAQAISYALQYGVPLQDLVDKFSHVRFEPSGMTQQPGHPLREVDRRLHLPVAGREVPVARSAVPRRREQPRGSDDARAARARRRRRLPPPEAPKSADAVVATHAKKSQFAAIQNQEDAPPCSTCGSIMVRSGACYKCTNCGTTSGCA